MLEIIESIYDVFDMSESVKEGVKGQIKGAILNGIEYKKWEKIWTYVNTLDKKSRKIMLFF